MAITKFQARHATLAYETSAQTWSTSAKLSAVTFDANVSEIKDMTLELPKQEVEKIDCLGNTAQTVGANHRTVGTATGIVAASFQNSALHRKSVTNWKLSGTAVLMGDEQFSQLLGLGTSGAITGGNTRYAIGSITSSAWTANQLGSLRVYWNNGSEEMSAVLSNVAITSIGDIKPTGADGYFEIEFSAECLPQHGAIEFKD